MRSLVLDITTKSFETSEKGHFNNHVKLARNDVHSHTFVSHEHIVWRVAINQLLQHNTATMSKRFLSIFKRDVVVVIDRRGDQKGAHWVVIEELTEANAATEHIDFIRIFVLQGGFEEHALA